MKRGLKYTNVSAATPARLWSFRAPYMLSATKFESVESLFGRRDCENYPLQLRRRIAQRQHLFAQRFIVDLFCSASSFSPLAVISTALFSIMFLAPMLAWIFDDVA